jgi:DNA-binding MarR family transcriptional regulator
MRLRRIEILGETFSTEAPFAILLALYTTEHRDAPVIITRVNEVACLAQTTTLRWLSVLASEGWITRSKIAGDRRRVFLSLTDQARIALDQLFSWPE